MGLSEDFIINTLHLTHHHIN